MHGLSLLPPWPVRQACISLDLDLTGSADSVLFDAVRRAAAVYHNNSYDQPCFNITGQAAPSANTTGGGAGVGDATPVVKYSGAVPNAKRSKMTSPRVPTRRLRPLGQQTKDEVQQLQLRGAGSVHDAQSTALAALAARTQHSTAGACTRRGARAGQPAG